MKALLCHAILYHAMPFHAMQKPGQAKLNAAMPTKLSCAIPCYDLCFPVCILKSFSLANPSPFNSSTFLYLFITKILLVHCSHVIH